MSLKKFYDAAQAANQKVTDLAEKIDALFEANKTEEALRMRPELDKAKAEAKEAEQLYISMREASEPSNSDPAKKFVKIGGDPEPKEVKDQRASNEYMQTYFKALRAGVTPATIKNGQHRGEQYQILMDVISETGGSPAGAEGGFLNPVDFDNKIIELSRQFIDMGNYVLREPAVAYSGWRVIEKAAAASPLTPMVELAVLDDNDEGESPEFVKVDYTLVDYGDFLRVSNDQMADTPVNLMAYLARWFAKKLVLTHTKYVLDLINALSPTAITDNTKTLQGIKTALNKTLNPQISATAGIFTNQSGLEVLDALVDGTGRPLMQPDPTNATRLMIKGRPVVFLDDGHWANLTAPSRARIAIGDLAEYAILFERPAFEFASTAFGGSAWRSNSTEVRGIARLDVEEADEDACALLTVAL